MNLDLHSLACFEAAATLLNFRAASGRMALSPAAFSDRIRRLEEDFGARLFDRSTRRVALTRAGLRLLPQARVCLAEAERCRVMVHDDGGAAPFEITVGTRFELGMSWLVPALKGFAEERPERRVNLYFGDSPALISRVERGQIDAMVSSVRLVGADLDYLTLHREDYAFVCTPDQLARSPLRTPGDAAQHRILDINRSLPLFRYFLDAWTGREPWDFADREFLGTTGAIRYRVLEGAGVAVLPEYFIGEDVRAGRLVRLFPDVELVSDAFRLVWRRGNRRAAELRELGESLRRLPLR